MMRLIAECPHGHHGRHGQYQGRFASGPAEWCEPKTATTPEDAARMLVELGHADAMRAALADTDQTGTD